LRGIRNAERAPQTDERRLALSRVEVVEQELRIDVFDRQRRD
jgi:hypothetical protein